jgi:RNA-directed DNA polymerase
MVTWKRNNMVVVNLKAFVGEEKMFEYLRTYREHFPKQKYFQLIDKVYDRKNLQVAWKKVKSNKECAGIDKQSIKDFQKQYEMHLSEMQRAVKQGTYVAMPTLRRFIPKGDNKFRLLGIPVVKDRILQQATKQVLEIIFEMKFVDNSFGYRPDRNAQQAVKQIKSYIDQGFIWVIDADVEQFFDSVDHTLLMNFIAEEISDGKVLNLIESWLKAGVMNKGKQEETLIGTPQGGVISPLLANIYLHEMDTQMLDLENVRFVRYADDFVVLFKTKEEAEQILLQVEEILSGLKLRLNKTKTRIANVNMNPIEFLGFKLKRRSGNLLITPRKKSIEKFKDAIRTLTWRRQPITPKDMVRRLNRTIMGWGHYFKIGNVKRIFERLDGWIRTRVRTFIEKKKSGFARMRLSGYFLRITYKLCSLDSLLKPHSL